MSILEMMSAEYIRSKKWYCLGIALQVGMVVLSLCKVIWDKSIINYFIFIFPILFFIVRHHMFWHKNLAERIRKELVISDSLGVAVPAAFCAEIRAFCSGLSVTDPLPKDYFSSKECVGPKRLIENVGESSFFTWHLAGLIRQVILGVAILFGIAVLSAGWWIIRSNPESINAKYSALLFSFLLVFSTSYFTEMYLNYKALEAQSERVFKNADIIIASPEIKESQAIKLLSDYNCMLVPAYPIPSWCYKLKQAQLNAAWNEYMHRTTK